jgi:Winged helix-turn-helix DNA-binding
LCATFIVRPKRGAFNLAGFVDSTVKEIDDRLRELKEEVARLEAARNALVGGRRRPGRPRAAAGTQPTPRRTAGRRPGRPRGRSRGGTRANQALELVRSTPGITIPQIAEKMGIEPNYLYRVMPRLLSDGQVKREGQGWHPAGS